MAGSDTDYDVVIIGGGISGLYTAWRLGTSTNLRVLVLEASDRFGGRYMTCKMPGGFAADLGAMRYVPLYHKILHALIEELEVKTKTFENSGIKLKNKFKFYLRNRRLQDIKDIQELYSIDDVSLQAFLSYTQFFFSNPSTTFDIKVPKNGDLSQATVFDTDQRAETMTVGQYLLKANNSEVLNLAAQFFPPPHWRLDVAAGEVDQLAPLWHTACAVDGGFEEVADAIQQAISTMPTIELRCHSQVLSIKEEETSTFSIVSGSGAGSSSCRSKRVVFACGTLGLTNVSIESNLQREKKLLAHTSKLTTNRAFKLYLTYTRPWWEEYGLHIGLLLTDLPLHQIVAFGDDGKTDTHATLLAAYSVTHVEMFEGLDHPSHERFVNLEGEVRDELVPSKRLVAFVDNQLRTVLGCPDIADKPVCAVRMIWGTATTEGIGNCPKVGVDSNRLHWESLKPFDDAELYIAGDVFPAWEKSRFYTGFSESALLTSERVLVNHFGLQPLREGISLENPWQ